MKKFTISNFAIKIHPNVLSQKFTYNINNYKNNLKIKKLTFRRQDLG